ncbi:MAG: MBL fold metallo-hydrolase [Deltaproteobacteria bacterium]|nr:MBL fold metallo-hydrolase [Deltaproteobacteria bacterium]
MSRSDQHKFRRKLWEVEEAIFVSPDGASVTEESVRAVLAPLAEGAGDKAEERASALGDLAAGRTSRADYLELHGACGVHKHVTAGGRSIFLLSIETFPNHVNNVYLVRERERAFLVDAGSQLPVAQSDFQRAGRVLAALHGQASILDSIGDVVITHGHFDHYGMAGHWRAQGARIHVHEMDARVLTNFAERIVVVARALRLFLEAGGIVGDELHELQQMYLFYKNAFKSVPVDSLLTDGADVLGATVYHVPGHCPGQVCLQIDNVLLTADHVLPRITAHQSPESITQSTGLDHYFESLEKIRRVGGVDMALPGHEEPIRDVSQRIREIEAFHRARLEKVRETCASEPRTLRQISVSLFGEQKEYNKLLAYEEAGAHVEYLERRGLLEIANLEDFETQVNPIVYYRAKQPPPQAP